MHILIAPDSYKGSLSSVQVAESIEKGILAVCPSATITKVPVADGGEGTVDALLSAVGGERFSAVVTGPMGDAVNAMYGILPDGTAVIEMASASGLPLLSDDERNAKAASTYGTGQLVKQVLDKGCSNIILGLGGSATNDGGAGAAAALGVRFLDDKGHELPRGGAALIDLASIDTSGLDARLGDVEIVLATDVNNPLCGHKGASAVFGPQKGASPEDVSLLDEALDHYAKVVNAQLGLDLASVAGAGAAGGLGYGMMVFCGAKMASGIDTVLEVAQVDELMAAVDLVITGEARIDGQSLMGKAPVGIGARAKKQGLPVIAIVGAMGEDAEQVYGYGVDAIVSAATGPLQLDYMMKNAAALVQGAAQRAMRLVLVGQELAEG